MSFILHSKRHEYDQYSLLSKLAKLSLIFRSFSTKIVKIGNFEVILLDYALNSLKFRHERILIAFIPFRVQNETHDLNFDLKQFLLPLELSTGNKCEKRKNWPYFLNATFCLCLMYITHIKFFRKNVFWKKYFSVQRAFWVVSQIPISFSQPSNSITFQDRRISHI